MSTKVNLRDIGWMYHAPPINEARDEIRVPPTSQIPGLGNMPDSAFPSDAENCRKNLFKSTDTPYITLAKMGGRADLLSIKQVSNKDQDPVGYPRCDWFYLEDNALEDAHKGSHKYVAQQPDYMVHQAYDPCDENRSTMSGGGKRKSRRAPFAMDTGRKIDPSELSKKIMEPRPSGYGIRNEKAKEADARRQVKLGKSSKGSTKQHDIEALVGQRTLQRLPDAIIMSKLLSNGYAREWDEQKRNMEKESQATGQPTRERVAAATEYSEMFEASAGHRKPANKETTRKAAGGGKNASSSSGKKKASATNSGRPIKA